MKIALYDPRRFKLVPLEPLPEQIDYVLEQRVKALLDVTNGGTKDHTLLDIYKDMVHAAPTKGPYR